MEKKMPFWLVKYVLFGILISVNGELNQSEYGCGKRHTHAHTFIIGGEDAKKGDWPWQVIISKNNGYRTTSFCGGALIDNQWVVTAAHCFPSVSNPTQYIIGIGYHDRTLSNNNETSRTDRRVVRIIKHPDWSTLTLDSDIALVQLESPVTFTKYISPVCLSTRENMLENKYCFITGWGKTSLFGGMVNYLQQGELPIKSQETCQQRNGQIRSVTSNMICAGNGGVGRDGKVSDLSGCHGDSGGPFVCKFAHRWELVGAVSWGPSDCASGKAYTVFARISKFNSWIKYNQAMYPSPPPTAAPPTTKPPNHKCSAFVPGDGMGGNEKYRGQLDRDACIDNCIAYSKTAEGAGTNGVSLPTSGTPWCYCEINMTRVEPMSGYKTCWLKLGLNTTDAPHVTNMPPFPTVNSTTWPGTTQWPHTDNPGTTWPHHNYTETTKPPRHFYKIVAKIVGKIFFN